MAMRPGTPTLRTPRSARPPVYENFQPMSELKENEQAHFLHIYLPGFTKESIKISYVASSRTVRIVGERRIDASNRWSRFNQSYPVPENCEVEKLQGKFEHGTLTVTMPKKFIPPPTPRAQVVETTKQKETTPPKSTPTRLGQQEPIGDQKSSDALKELKGTQKYPSPSQKPKDISHRPEDFKGLRTLSPSKPFEAETALKTKATAAIPKEKTGKPQEGIEPKPTLITRDLTKQIDEEKLQEEMRKKNILETVKKQLEEEKAEKESAKKKEVKGEDIGKPYYESGKPEKYVVHDVVLKEKEIKARKESAPKASSEKKKDKSKEDETYTIGKGIKEMGTLASKVVTKIGEGKLDDQDKTLVANMGAAILVIAALGAYVTYKFTSSGKP